jgi:bacteriorhodopsin
MLTIYLHYVAWAFLNPYLLGEAHLHDDANAKEALNKVLQRIVCTLTTYALVLTDLAIFVEN